MVAITSPRPIIWAAGISRLSGAFAEIVPGFADRADIRIIEKGFEAAAVAVEAAARERRVDAVVSGGANGAYLRQHVSVPVILVRVTGFDVLSALATARRVSPRIALVTHASVYAELEDFCRAFDLDIPLHTYLTGYDASTLVLSLKTAGTEVVVGPGLVTDLADKAGMTGVFLYSGNSVRAAMIDAIDAAQAIQRVDRNLRSRNRPRGTATRYTLDDLLGDSPSIAAVRTLARRYAQVDSTVLIRGDSGTGKEVIAQGMHHASPRHAFPFVAVNCAAFPEPLLESELFGYQEGAFSGASRGGKVGLIEAAHNGTLFLDEIGDMSPALQVRLLRVLQERQVLPIGGLDPVPVNVRVVAATHRDLPARVAEGLFREDLLFRLNILRIDVAPLRDRMQDVPVIADVLYERILGRLNVPAQRLPEWVHAALMTYSWPGNVRELENVLERVAVLGAGDGPADARDGSGQEALRQAIPEIFGSASVALATRTPPATYPCGNGVGSAALAQVSRHSQVAHIHRVLADCNGDRAAACRVLGISSTTLWRRLRAAT
jgi:propionate catabolism operon transcriptional regulator